MPRGGAARRVVEFSNPSLSAIFFPGNGKDIEARFPGRVQGTLNGVRIRRNFKTPEGAAAEKAALEVSTAQLNSNLRSVSTWLSEPQVREAESVFARLPAGGRPMAFFFDLGIASHRERNADAFP